MQSKQSHSVLVPLSAIWVSGTASLPVHTVGLTCSAPASEGGVAVCKDCLRKPPLGSGSRVCVH